MKVLNTVGKRVPNVDGLKIVTGAAVYAHDIVLPRMVYGKILRSPHAHARIRSIDVREAEALPGVCAVITAADTLKIKYVNLGPPLEDKMVLADDRVRYIGDDVAAVAAATPEIAAKAIGLIRVDYEVLPAVFDPEKAMEPGAPQLYDGVARNIAAHGVRNFGDVEKGFAEADHVFEDRYSTQGVAHCCMEPRTTVAMFDLEGNLTIWASTQSPYFVRKELAHVLDMPITKVRIREVHVGGGFGARSKVCEDEGIAAYLAKKARRPVKITLTREEEFSTTRLRHPMVMRLKTGVKKDGRIVARQCTLITDNGAYNQMGPAVTGFAGAVLASLYRVPNVRFDGYTVYTNKHFGGPFRGYGSPQITFAIESQMDTIAQKLGLDPVELRLRNANRSGDVTPCGWKITSCGFEQCITQAAQVIGWADKKKSPVPRRGVGLASLIHCSGAYVYRDGDFSSADVRVTMDGKVLLLVSAADMGTWAKTALAQIAAEELGCPLSDVRVLSMDTEVAPLDMGSWGSRVTFICGNAVKKAAADAKGQLLESAAQKLEANPADLEIREGRIFVQGSPARNLPIGEAVAASGRKIGASIIGRGHYETPTEIIDRKTGYGNISAAYTFATQVAEVEVNPETGQVRVLRVVAAHDVGQPINPLSVEGQIEGSVAMGVGFALLEEFKYQNGRILNPSFLDFRIPTVKDMPQVEPIIVQTDDPEGPFGAKAIGEAALIPTAAAIANAVYDAVGVRIRDLPITEEKILQALREKEKGKAT